MQGDIDKPFARSTGLAERVANHISSVILDSGMQPGAKLPSMADLETRFQVSHSVMREALRMLQSRGIVEIQHGKGVIVSPHSTEALSDTLGGVLRLHASTIYHLMEYRYLLEVAVVQLAAERRNEEDLLRMEGALRSSEGEPNRAVYVDADLAFHNALVDATRNPVLRTVSDSIRRLMANSREVSFRGPKDGVGRALQAHREIYERVKARDVEGARLAMVSHLDQTQEDLDLAICEGRLGSLL